MSAASAAAVGLEAPDCRGVVAPGSVRKDRQDEEIHEDEDLDPRIKVELEKLNSSTDVINKLELDLEEARSTFRHLLAESSRQLDLLHQELGPCVDKARPYYEARMKAKVAHFNAQRAATRFEKACSAHEAAKEMVTLAEKGFQERGVLHFDQAWQEMLNHATARVNESEFEKNASSAEHRTKSWSYQLAEQRVRLLHKCLRRSISKSMPYFETKAKMNQTLDDQKKHIEVIEETIRMTKTGYSDTLRGLERISEDIHAKRQKNSRCGRSKKASSGANSASSLSGQMAHLPPGSAQSVLPAEDCRQRARNALLGGTVQGKLDNLDEKDSKADEKALQGKLSKFTIGGRCSSTKLISFKRVDDNGQNRRAKEEVRALQQQSSSSSSSSSLSSLSSSTEEASSGSTGGSPSSCRSSASGSQRADFRRLAKGCLWSRKDCLDGALPGHKRGPKAEDINGGFLEISSVEKRGLCRQLSSSMSRLARAKPSGLEEGSSRVPATGPERVSYGGGLGQDRRSIKSSHLKTAVSGQLTSGLGRTTALDSVLSASTPNFGGFQTNDDLSSECESLTSLDMLDDSQIELLMKDEAISCLDDNVDGDDGDSKAPGPGGGGPI